MKQYARPALIAGLIGLAGCAQSGTTYGPSDRMTQIDSYYIDGAAGRDIKLEVWGDPFQMPKDVFARTVENDLKDAPLQDREPTHPTLTPNSSAKPIYRVVYVFNSGSLTGNDICKVGDYKWNGPPPSRVQATAAFCVLNRAITEITGEVNATSPSDVGFYRLTREMLADIFRPDVGRNMGPPPGAIRIN